MHVFVYACLYITCMNACHEIRSHDLSIDKVKVKVTALHVSPESGCYSLALHNISIELQKVDMLITI